jgi:hypothetical protein
VAWQSQIHGVRWPNAPLAQRELFLRNPDMSSSASLRALSWFALFTGLGVVVWVASGFVGTSAFALAMTLLIGAVYLGGAWELRRFGQTTSALNTALGSVSQPLNQLADWLPRVPASLQHAVRQRVEGERSAFPGLALTPYLIGLLVMLGMLGTFLGMVVTFKGAVFALEGSADLTAIRSALAAPIKGLGLSFGTSVAGVATSAMLGLMATLARRERSQAIRALDALSSTTLRPFSAAHQRQRSFEALQRQAEAMPAAAEHLQTLIEQMERRSQQLDEALLARQADFQSQAASAYTGLAESVDRSLRESLAASVRAATDSLQPVVQQAMAGIAAESSRLHEGVGAAVQAQLAGLSTQFGATTQALASGWTRALAERAQADQQQQAAWTASLQSLAQSLQGEWQQAGAQAQAQQQAALQALEQSAAAIAEQSREQASRSLDGVARLIGQTDALVQARAQSEAAWTQEHGQRMDALASLWRSELAALRSEEAARQQAAAQRAAELQAGVAQQLASLRDGAAKQLATLREAETTRQQAQTAQQERALAALTQQLQSLREEEGARSEAAVQRLGGLTTALSTQLAAQLSALGSSLEAPMARLMHTASEAPKAAAEVIAQLREQMSRLAERDNATLVERADLVGQIGTLLQQVQQTTGEQRAAIENLVGSATGVLDRVGQQFANTVGAQAGRAEAMAEQAATSAVQLAALGEAFQQGAQQLATSHEQLVHSLQRVEGAIGQSLARSDEQLAYYVAQAREVIDLSISAQQGIVEDLRQLRGPRAPAKATASAA